MQTRLLLSTGKMWPLAKGGQQNCELLELPQHLPEPLATWGKSKKGEGNPDDSITFHRLLGGKKETQICIYKKVCSCDNKCKLGLSTTIHKFVLSWSVIATTQTNKQLPILLFHFTSVAEPISLMSDTYLLLSCRCFRSPVAPQKITCPCLSLFSQIWIWPVISPVQLAIKPCASRHTQTAAICPEQSMGPHSQGCMQSTPPPSVRLTHYDWCMLWKETKTLKRQGCAETKQQCMN